MIGDENHEYLFAREIFDSFQNHPNLFVDERYVCIIVVSENPSKFLGEFARGPDYTISVDPPNIVIDVVTLRVDLTSVIEFTRLHLARWGGIHIYHVEILLRGAERVMWTAKQRPQEQWIVTGIVSQELDTPLTGPMVGMPASGPRNVKTFIFLLPATRRARYALNGLQPFDPDYSRRQTRPKLTYRPEVSD